MSDWVWFGSLAFPAFFQALTLGVMVWLALRFMTRNLSSETWFWHMGLVELSTLVICIAGVSRLLQL